MKQVINGKMYNTETAREITDWTNGRNLQDFYYYKEELYKKKTGEFFLYGKGNAASKYGEWCDKGGRIIPLSKSGAKAWVEEYSDADTYIELFGEVAE